jgi:hypothetical protein
MAGLFTSTVYVYIYVCLHYFLTNILNSRVRKDSLGFSSLIFCIIHSLVFSYNKNQFSTTAHSVYYVLSFFPHFIVLSFFFQAASDETALDDLSSLSNVGHDSDQLPSSHNSPDKLSLTPSKLCNLKILPTFGSRISLVQERQRTTSPRN